MDKSLSERFLSLFDKKVEAPIVNDSIKISEDVKESEEIELGETTYVKHFETRFVELVAAIDALELFVSPKSTGTSFDLKDPISGQKYIEKILSDVHDTVENKQHILGLCIGIIGDGKEVLRLQTHIIGLARLVDPKLTSESLLFIKNEQEIISLSQTCYTSLNQIIKYLQEIEHMDINNLTPKKVKNVFTECTRLVGLIKKYLALIRTNIQKIDSHMVNATKEVMAIHTENVELKARLKYLHEIMAKGRQDVSGGEYIPDNYNTKKNMEKVLQGAKRDGVVPVDRRNRTTPDARISRKDFESR